MNYLKLRPLVLLSIFLLLSSTFLFSPSHAQGEEYDDDDDTMRRWKEKKSKFQESNSVFALAANRTRRIDPSNDFKLYEGGWDVTNSHYYLSLVYSAAPVLSVAGVWFFSVALFLIIAFCCCCCCYYCCCCFNNMAPKLGFSPKISLIPLIFLALFLVMAIGGAGLLYNGQVRFQNTTNEVMDVFVRRTISVVDVLENVLDNFHGAMNMSIGNNNAAYSLPLEFKQSIEQIQNLFDVTSSIPRDGAKKVVHVVNQFLDVVNYWVRVVAAVILALIVIGFITSVCGCKLLVYFLLLIGWILVTGTFILCGVTLVVENGVGDTCVAMEDWLEHPENRTVLTKLLPCVDDATAKQAQDLTRNTSLEIVTMANEFLRNVANSDKSPGQEEEGKIGVFYNQSGPHLPLLCTPYHQDMTERTCGPHEIRLDAAPQAYQSFVCSTSSSGMCNSKGRLTPDLYSQTMAAANMSHTLYKDGPFLVGLADCTFVAETFDEINEEHCSNMRLYTSHVFIGLMLLSLACMLSVIFWVVNVNVGHIHKPNKFCV